MANLSPSAPSRGGRVARVALIAAALCALAVLANVCLQEEVIGDLNGGVAAAGGGRDGGVGGSGGGQYGGMGGSGGSGVVLAACVEACMAQYPGAFEVLMRPGPGGRGLCPDGANGRCFVGDAGDAGWGTLPCSMCSQELCVAPGDHLDEIDCLRCIIDPGAHPELVPNYEEIIACIETTCGTDGGTAVSCADFYACLVLCG